MKKKPAKKTRERMRSAMTPEAYRAARHALGLTQEQLGLMLGVHKMTILKRENGTCNITTEAAAALMAIKQNHARKLKSEKSLTAK